MVLGKCRGLWSWRSPQLAQTSLHLQFLSSCRSPMSNVIVIWSLCYHLACIMSRDWVIKVFIEIHLPSIYNISSKLLLTPTSASHTVWFQLRAVLQVKAALTAILYPAVHFLPDYLIRIQIQISETLHSCSWLIFLQNMSKPFFRPRLQGQFLFGDF